MAGLGIGPTEFALFEIDDPAERAEALEAVLQPKLAALGALCLSGLGRVAGKELTAHPGKITRRRTAPEELLVVFCDQAKGYRGIPYLAVAITPHHFHARVGVRGDSPRREAMQRALEREAPNLAKKGKPFRKLRQYAPQWDHRELPELAPAHSVAFWLELGEDLAPGRPGLDVGIAWTREEARSLSIGDLLGVFRDLSPLYKVLANAG
jgi:uncharacterized protein YktB (UPF0637 family)